MSQNSKKRITEKRNSKSTKIDQMETNEILKLINEEDQKVAKAVEKEIPDIEKAVDIITDKMRRGGRLFYVGAGTSGRLGVLDAVECEPTFSISPEKVVGILAGGKNAMFKSKENIEDKEELGRKRIADFNIKRNDTVVGIAASGKTPFVIGALKEANKKNGFSIALTCTENSILERESKLSITPIVGPEVVTGSTRMKAGSAQKMVLNMLSTTVMINLGKVYSNLMVDLNASNEKLRIRAQDIFTLITDAGNMKAKNYLKKTDYALKEAIIMYEKQVNQRRAKELLKKNNGILRKIIN